MPIGGDINLELAYKYIVVIEGGRRNKCKKIHSSKVFAELSITERGDPPRPVNGVFNIANVGRRHLPYAQEASAFSIDTSLQRSPQGGATGIGRHKYRQGKGGWTGWRSVAETRARQPPMVYRETRRRQQWEFQRRERQSGRGARADACAGQGRDVSQTAEGLSQTSYMKVVGRKWRTTS